MGKSAAPSHTSEPPATPSPPSVPPSAASSPFPFSGAAPGNKKASIKQSVTSDQTKARKSILRQSNTLSSCGTRHLLSLPTAWDRGIKPLNSTLESFPGEFPSDTKCQRSHPSQGGFSKCRSKQWWEGTGVLHPGRQEMKEETPRECATGEVPHPLLASANILQPVPTSKVPTEEQTLPSHLPCALQGPLLLPRPCAGDTDVPAERDRLAQMRHLLPVLHPRKQAMEGKMLYLKTGMYFGVF